METEDLPVFVALDQNGTLKKTGDATCKSISTVARDIRNCEHYVDAKLFDHYVNKMKLNRCGRAFLRQIEPALSAFENLHQSVQDVLKYGDVYVLQSCDPIPSLFMSNEIVNKLHNKTDTEVFTDIQEAIFSLEKDKIDFLVTDKPIEQEDLECQFMAHDSMLLSVDKEDKRFLDSQEISLADKSINELVYFDSRGEFFNKVHRALERMPIETRVKPESEYLHYLLKLDYKDIITTSTRLADSFTSKFIDRKSIPITDADTSIDYYLVYKKSHKEEFADVLELAKEWAEKYH